MKTVQNMRIVFAKTMRISVYTFLNVVEAPITIDLPQRQTLRPVR